MGAIVDHLLSLVGEELRDRPPAPRVAARVPAGASGLHVIHAAALHLQTVTPDTTPESLVALIAADTRRAQILERLEVGGLRDADLRLLSTAASLFLGRTLTFGDFDPLELFSDRMLTMLRIGARQTGLVHAGSSSSSTDGVTRSPWPTPREKAWSA